MLRSPQWPRRAQGSHRVFSLRALAAQKLLRLLTRRRLAAAVISAIHAIRGEDLRGNLQVADNAGVRLPWKRLAYAASELILGWVKKRNQ